MNRLAIITILLNLFSSVGYCSDPFSFNFNWDDDLLMNSCDFILEPEESYHNNTPKSHAKRPKEDEESKEDGEYLPNPNQSAIKKPRSTKERKYPPAGKSIPEPTSQRGIMSSAQSLLLNDNDWDDESGTFTGRNKRIRKQTQLLDPTHIMGTRTNKQVMGTRTKKQAQVLFEIDSDKIAGIICPQRNCVTPEDPNLPTWTLTRDITILIFGFLDGTGIKDAAHTCGFFANVSNRRPTLKFARGVAEQNVASVLATKCKFLRHLDMSQCAGLSQKTFLLIAKELNLSSFVPYPCIRAKLLEALGEHNQNLTHIKLVTLGIRVHSKTYYRSSPVYAQECVGTILDRDLYPMLTSIELTKDAALDYHSRNWFAEFIEARNSPLIITLPPSLVISDLANYVKNPLVKVVIKKPA